MYTIGSEITKLKIKRNLLIVKLLELENKIVKLEMVQKYRLLQYNITYTGNLKKIIALEAQQLARYKNSREYEIKLLVDNLNQSFLNTDDLDVDLQKLKNECNSVIQQLNVVSCNAPLISFVLDYEKN